MRWSLVGLALFFGSGCGNPLEGDEPGECSDGADNDGDGAECSASWVDENCPLTFPVVASAVNQLLASEFERTRRAHRDIGNLEVRQPLQWEGFILR